MTELIEVNKKRAIQKNSQKGQVQIDYCLFTFFYIKFKQFLIENNGAVSRIKYIIALQYNK